ncbi:MAG: O-antigen ligase family protein [Flavobacteriales bacterium]|nr:O-antigen ligase family protein [Flavobacteriales bacterium]
MKRQFLFALFFGVGLFFSCLGFHSSALDQTLFPRWFFFGIFVLILTIAKLRTNPTIVWHNILYIPLIFLIWVMLSYTWAGNSTLFFAQLSKYLLIYMFALCLALLFFKSKDDFLKLFLRAITITALVVVTITLLEMFQLPDLSRKSLYLLKGINGHKNLISSFLYLCLIFTSYAFFWHSKNWKYLSGGVSVLIIALILMIQTRSAYLSLVLFISLFGISRINKLIMALRRINTFKASLIMTVSCLALLLIVLPYFSKNYIAKTSTRINTESLVETSTFSERLHIWENTFKLIKENPILGCGAGNWQINYIKYGLPKVYRIQDLNVTFQRPHNDFLWMFSEYGIVVFSLMIFLFFWLIINLIKLTAHNQSASVQILYSGLIGFLPIAFFSFSLERAEHNVLFCSLLVLSYFQIATHGRLQKGFNINIPKSIFVILIPTVFFSLFLILKNVQGEYFMRKIYVAMSNEDYEKVGLLGKSIDSKFYSLDPTTVPVDWYAGNAMASLKQYDEAYVLFLNALKAHPFSFHTLNDIGSASYAKGSIDSAIYYYQYAAQINPRYDDAKLNLVTVYMEQGDFEMAKQWNDLIYHNSPRRTKIKEQLDAHFNSPKLDH